MPNDVHIDFLRAQHPDIYEYVFSGSATVNKNLPAHWNRAVWYNDADKKHTFNRLYVRCRAHAALVKEMVNGERADELPHLQILYAMACVEFDGVAEEGKHYGKVPFELREIFLREWQSSGEDIYVLTRGEIDRYKSIASQLAAALPVLPELTPAAAAEAAEDLEELHPVYSVLMTGEMDVGGEAYTQHMAGADEADAHIAHEAWVLVTLEEMERNARFLLSQVPVDYELVERYRRKITDVTASHALLIELERMSMGTADAADAMDTTGAA